MAIQSESKSPSRRALLAGALGGIGAWVAGTIGRVKPAVATDGQALIVGTTNSTITETYLTNTADNSGIFVALSSGSGTGLHGQSGTGRGVEGTSGTVGVLGASAAGTGVLGFGGASTPPPYKPKTGVYGYADTDSGSVGVFGGSPDGHGIHGRSSAGWAGYFDGRIFGNSYLELKERSNPSAPTSNRARLYVRDNGSGKTQLCVRFHNGVIRVLATA